MQFKEGKIKRSTLLCYKLSVKSHIIPVFGNHTSICEDEVQKFADKMVKSGLKKKTARDIIAILRQLAKYGARRGVFRYEEWQIDYPTDTEDRRVPVLSLSDQRKLTEKLTEEPNAKNIGILLSLCGGLRIGEVCALKWDDVDMKNKVIQIGKTAGRLYDCEKKRTETIVSEPKTRNSYREVPISNTLMQALRKVKKTSRGAIYVTGGKEIPCDPRNYRDYFYRLSRRIGIQEIVYHGLRHTFATRCVESRCDIKTLSSILGHSNVAITMNLYVHPDITQKKKCIERMDSMINTINKPRTR